MQVGVVFEGVESATVTLRPACARAADVIGARRGEPWRTLQRSSSVVDSCQPTSLRSAAGSDAPPMRCTRRRAAPRACPRAAQRRDRRPASLRSRRRRRCCRSGGLLAKPPSAYTRASSRRRRRDGAAVSGAPPASDRPSRSCGVSRFTALRRTADVSSAAPAAPRPLAARPRQRGPRATPRRAGRRRARGVACASCSASGGADARPAAARTARRLRARQGCIGTLAAHGSGAGGERRLRRTLERSVTSSHGAFWSRRPAASRRRRRVRA